MRYLNIGNQLQKEAANGADRIAENQGKNESGSEIWGKSLGCNLRCRLLSGSLFGLASILILLLVADRIWPPPLPAADLFARTLTDARGEILRTRPAKDGVLRYPITPGQVSPLYREALLNYEDRWFYWHPGINPLALIRAVQQWLFKGQIVSGGSTLTMQVARILEPHPRTLAGKARQMLRALQLEWHLSKDEILGLYLNLAPFGANLAGVEAASRGWLGKPAQNLSHAEAALLAVLPQAPSRLRPDRWPRRAQAARNKVLERLGQAGVWDTTSLAEAKAEIIYAQRPTLPMQAPLLAERLWHQQPERQSIQTLIDGQLQSRLEALLRDYIQSLPKPASAAAMVLRNTDGAVLASVGSADFANARRFGFLDMTQAIRSPGSSLKPFLYALAIDEGLIHSQSLLFDIPRGHSDYRPGNFNQGFRGPVTASQALQLSLNLPAVQLLEHYGPARFTARLEDAGLQLRIPGDGRPSLSIILGGLGVKLEQLVGIYAAFGRQGMSIRPRYQPDEPLRERRLISAGAAWIGYRMLADNPARTQVAGRLGQGQRELAWKTGTSYGYRDSWALGTSLDFSIGVWLGRPDNTPLPGTHALANAAPLLFRIAALLPTDRQPVPRPASVQEAIICHPSGMLKTQTQPADCHNQYRAWLLEATAPPTLNEMGTGPAEPEVLVKVNAQGERLLPGCEGEVSSERRLALWPRSLEPWLPENLKASRLLPPLAPGCSGPASGQMGLGILNIQEGTIYSRAGTAAKAPQLELRAIGGQGARYWYINGNFSTTTRGEESYFIRLTKTGPTQITVLDEAGNLDQRTLHLQ